MDLCLYKLYLYNFMVRDSLINAYLSECVVLLSPSSGVTIVLLVLKGRCLSGDEVTVRTGPYTSFFLLICPEATRVVGISITVEDGRVVSCPLHQ